MKKVLRDKQLPKFSFKDQEYEMLGGVSRLDFGRKITQAEQKEWLRLEVEAQARKAIPGLVGKSFRQTCRNIVLPAELIECPASRRTVDYGKTIERLKRSIERKKDAKASKTKASKTKASKTKASKTKASKTKAKAVKLAPKK